MFSKKDRKYESWKMTRSLNSLLFFYHDKRSQWLQISSRISQSIYLTQEKTVSHDTRRM